MFSTFRIAVVLYISPSSVLLIYQVHLSWTRVKSNSLILEGLVTDYIGRKRSLSDNYVTY